MTDRDGAPDPVQLGDLDELVREVDRRSERRDWDGLVDLRDRCRRALDTGRQLWPIASLCEYRLALEAPGPWAAAVLVEGAGHFAAGPLPEVAASTHTWGELAGHLDDGPAAGLAAHERVLRGEDLRSDEGATRVGAVLELPLALQAWEPAYALAEYTAEGVSAPAPALPEVHAVPLRPRAPRLVEDPDALGALTDLARAWTTRSNGRTEAVAVQGDALAALVALGLPSVRLAELTPQQALAAMAWTGASGGAHGPRRGAATGRSAAWWALAALAGLIDDWPLPPDELGAVAGELRWWAWDAAEPGTGWSLRLAVEDPAEGLAWALVALDAA